MIYLSTLTHQPTLKISSVRTLRIVVRTIENTVRIVERNQTFEKYRNGCLKPLFETEVVHEYPTLETLAKGEKINVDGLLQTVKDYNEDVAKGKDRHFGRTKLLQTLDKGPFYAFEAEPRIYTSYSGLEINTKGQVLDTRSKPIPGLYAAGDVCGHLGYQANLGGGGISGLSCAAVYGRITGKEAAVR
ncbi:FAD-binding protein [uncultured Parasutterella sp.]|uniref:FAD-binding protein n=3 Tax=uncultured Parasutterella sp. TaxID=1263098 RepID=UPI0025B607B3|nr:FAD-binding protein [uncultured Parasutterella sp.]